MRCLRIIYAGTPTFAVPALKRLVADGHEIGAVFTQPDRPAGRGRRYRASPIKSVAIEQGLTVYQPERLGPQEREWLAYWQPDLMIVAAYGQILSRGVLDVPRFGSLNIHASLLPRWRGAAPIQRALLAGDRETGVSLMRMTPGMDEGPIIATRSTPITGHDTGGLLHDRLAELGATIMGEPLRAYIEGECPAQNQPATGITYAPKIDKAEACIDWSESSALIERQVRAFNPWPVAYTTIRGTNLRIWSAETVAPEIASGSPPAAVVRADSQGLVVATGDGGVRLTELQPAGKQRQTAAAFVNGHAVALGEQLGG